MAAGAGELGGDVAECTLTDDERDLGVDQRVGDRCVDARTAGLEAELAEGCG